MKGIGSLKWLPLLLTALLSGFSLYSQEVPEKQPAGDEAVIRNDFVLEQPSSLSPYDDIVFGLVQEMPRFPGCEGEYSQQAKKDCAENKFMEYLAGIEYPAEAKKKGQQGKVYVKYVINTDGSVSDVSVTWSSGYDLLDQAAIDHISAMPKWTPGYQKGYAVKVQFDQPIYFKLSDPAPTSK